MIYSALQRNATTLRKVLAPFSFSHVIDACSFLSLFFLFLFLFLDFIVISDFVFNKTIILLGLAGYQMIITKEARSAELVIYHLLYKGLRYKGVHYIGVHSVWALLSSFRQI